MSRRSFKRWTPTRYKGRYRPITFRRRLARGSRYREYAPIPRYQGASAKASRALTLIRKFKKEEERKFLINEAATMQIPIAGDWIAEGFGPYCQVGTTNITRIGNKITVESLTIKWTINHTVLPAIGDNIRLVIAMDRRPAGVDSDPAWLMNTDNQINSCYNIQEIQRGKFQVLMDEVVSFDSATGMKSGKAFFKGPWTIRYDDGNAGTVADLQKNNFMFMAMSSPAGAAIDVNYGFKFTFTDA